MDNSKDLTVEDVWVKVLDSLQKELSPQVCERWLRPIKPVEMKGQELFLSVPDEFFKSWIIDHYGNMISLAVKEVLEDPSLKVSFSISNGTAAAPAAGSQEDRPSASGSAASLYSNVPVQGEVQLNSRYTFESFVVGPSNRFAQAASLAVAEAPAKAPTAETVAATSEESTGAARGIAETSEAVVAGAARLRFAVGRCRVSRRRAPAACRMLLPAAAAVAAHHVAAAVGVVVVAARLGGAPGVGLPGLGVVGRRLRCVRSALRARGRRRRLAGKK